MAATGPCIIAPSTQLALDPSRADRHAEARMVNFASRSRNPRFLPYFVFIISCGARREAPRRRCFTTGP